VDTTKARSNGERSLHRCPDGISATILCSFTTGSETSSQKPMLHAAKCHCRSYSPSARRSLESSIASITQALWQCLEPRVKSSALIAGFLFCGVFTARIVRYRQGTCRVVEENFQASNCGVHCAGVCIMLNKLKHFSYSVVSSIKWSSLVGEKSARLGLHGSH
jgi:hypothetical protein